MIAALIVAASALSADGVWIDVPFIRQEKDGCGAAAIAMVMEHWARNGGPAATPHAAILSELRKGKGIRAADMIRYFRDKGYRAFAFKGEWRDLGEHVARGRPLIVCLDEGGSTLHYVVVAGVEENIALVNDPARRKLLKVDRASFESRWKDRWTLLALPQ